MTVKELIKELKKYPPNMDVFLDERLTEFKYGLVNSVRERTVDNDDIEDGDPFGAEAIILSED